MLCCRRFFKPTLYLMINSEFRARISKCFAKIMISTVLFDATPYDKLKLILLLRAKCSCLHKLQYSPREKPIWYVNYFIFTLPQNEALIPRLTSKMNRHINIPSYYIQNHKDHPLIHNLTLICSDILSSISYKQGSMLLKYNFITHLQK